MYSKIKIILALIIIGSGLLLSMIIFKNGTETKIRYPFALKSNTGQTATQNLAEDIALYTKRTEGDPQGALDPATLAELYVVQGKATGDMKSFDAAEIYARLSLKNRSASNPGPSLVLADVAQAKHQFANAIQIANNVLKMRPGASEVLPILVSSYLAIGDLKNANLYAERLVDDGRSTNALALRALSREAQGRDAEALEDYMRGIQAEESDGAHESAWVRCLLGRFYLDRGEFKEAEIALTEALRAVPSDPMALGLLARRDEETGDWKKATEAYRDAFEKSKQIPFLLGEARALSHTNLQSANNLRKQAETLLRAELNDKGYGHRSELIRLLLERGNPEDFSEAVDVARVEIAGRPNTESYHLLAWALLKTGDIDGARSAIRTALQSGARRAEIYYHAGLIEKAADDPVSADFYLVLAKQMNFQPAVTLDTSVHTLRWPKWLAIR
jgi:tetratricopeptide (TPR) repeat protein